VKSRLAVVLAAALAPGLASAAVVSNTFIASCTPSQETASPSVSNSSCIATFIHEPAAGHILYKLRCNNITGVVAAHIHNGNADTANGGINQFLYNGPTTGAVNGLLTSGEITRAALGDVPFDALVTAMRGDNVYVNVHTTANSGGEVRGQVVPLAVQAVRSLNY
jgi:hypothetical protein